MSGRASRPGWRSRWQGGSDDGRVMLLTIGFVVVALLMIAGISSVAALHLERKRLYGLTDFVALDATDSVTPWAYRAAQAEADGQVRGLPLTDEGVYDSVVDYLERRPEATETWESLEILEASSPDGQAAVVELEIVVAPGPVSWLFTFWGDGVTLRARSVAYAL